MYFSHFWSLNKHFLLQPTWRKFVNIILTKNWNKQLNYEPVFFNSIQLFIIPKYIHTIKFYGYYVIQPNRAWYKKLMLLDNQILSLIMLVYNWYLIRRYKDGSLSIDSRSRLDLSFIIFTSRGLYIKISQFYLPSQIEVFSVLEWGIKIGLG